MARMTDKKMVEIERMIEEAEEIDFSQPRWSQMVLAKHVVEAGRLRLNEGKQYYFPGYCRFPYNEFLKNCITTDRFGNQMPNWDQLPFKPGDHDARWKLRCLAEGMGAYYDMRNEHHRYVKKLITTFMIPSLSQFRGRKIPASEIIQTSVNADEEMPVANTPPVNSGDLPNVTPSTPTPPLLPVQHSTPDAVANQAVPYQPDLSPIPTAGDGDGAAAGPSTLASNINFDDFDGFGDEPLPPNARSNSSNPHVQRLSEILNANELNRVQEYEADPNEIAPIRRRPPRGATRHRRRYRAQQNDYTVHMGQFLLLDADAMVNADEYEEFDLLAIEGDLPLFVDNEANDQQPIDQNAVDVAAAAAAVIQQINLNDDIELELNQPQQQTIDPLPLPQQTIGQQPNVQPPGQTTDGNLQTSPALANQIQPGAENAVIIRDAALQTAVRQLGKKRRRARTEPKQKKFLQISKLTIDPTTLEVQRIPEKDYEFHPRLHPGVDLSPYFERISELLVDHEYVAISDFIITGWNENERSAALQALTIFATDNFIRIETEKSRDSENRRVVGFEFAALGTSEEATSEEATQ